LLPGRRVGAPVIDPRRGHLHRPGAGQYLPRLVMPVPHHQAAAAPVPLARERRDISVHLGLQLLGQHPPRALPHDLVDQRAPTSLSLFRRPLLHYREHGRTFPAGVAAPALLETSHGIREGTPPGLIHRSQALLPAE
jgi:hypothetical protein